MKVTVDRIENGIAILLIRPEEKYSFEIPVEYLPEKSNESDILSLEFKKEISETEEAKKRVKNLIEKLKNK
ncbi:DUF3006 domain-containing protein [Halanaerobiaceae bacterium Z-7014]|uniref:DUF3006 domain-containing protein n=1 Tax=Halonatronomonas betaini TaxID=2778430 RepID=A0A931F767_9FIRM|nr:DUF3006 domain-containing protein [Halonatronomonas betaini]MBF8436316.1 DUF3006 domain-containing protein [Halonatronomonas betaini]